MKELWIVAGPNGGGKTTWIEQGLVDLETSVYLSADQIAAEISPERPEAARFTAGREFLARFERCLQAGESLVVESTLSGRGMERFIDRAKALGYRVIIVFIFLESADLCVLRVAQRVKTGGHDVPEADIRRRYERSKRRFWQRYRQSADEWHLFYNAAHRFEPVASGDGGHLRIDRPELMSSFLES